MGVLRCLGAPSLPRPSVCPCPDNLKVSVIMQMLSSRAFAPSPSSVLPQGQPPTFKVQAPGPSC